MLANNSILLACSNSLLLAGTAVASPLNKAVNTGDVVKFKLNLPELLFSAAVNDSVFVPLVRLPASLAAYEFQPMVVFGASRASVTVETCSRDATNAVADSDSSVFLCDVIPEEVQGAMGVGRDLGYFPPSYRPAPAGSVQDQLTAIVPEANAGRLLPLTEAPALQRRSVVVKGEAATHCVSLRVPDEGASFAKYDLRHCFDTLRFSVGITDDVAETLSPAVCTVLGDGKQLWTSQPLHKVAADESGSHVLERAEVSVAGVKELTLRVESTGIAALTQVVWVDPLLIIAHSGDSGAAVMPVSPLATGDVDESKAEEAADYTPLLTRAHVQAALQMVRQAVIWQQSLFPVMESPWRKLADSAPHPHPTSPAVYSSEMLMSATSLHEGVVDNIDPQQRSSPFIAEPFADVIDDVVAILQMLAAVTHNAASTATADVDAQIAVGAMFLEADLLHLLQRNVEVLTLDETIDVQDYGFSRTEPFRAVIDVLFQLIRRSADAGPLKAVSNKAMHLLESGASAFFPTLDSRLTLLQTVSGAALVHDGSGLLDPDTFAPSKDHALYGIAVSLFREIGSSEFVRDGLPAATRCTELARVATFVIELMRRQSTALIDGSDGALQFTEFLVNAGEDVLMDSIDTIAAAVSDINVLAVSVPLEQHNAVVALMTLTGHLCGAASAILTALTALSPHDVYVPALLHNIPVIKCALHLLSALPLLIPEWRLAEAVSVHVQPLVACSRKLFAACYDETSMTASLTRWAQYHDTFIARNPVHPLHRKNAVTNVFNSVFTGEYDGFDGQVGFCFTVNGADLHVHSLGRSVNMSVRGGALQQPHVVRLWDDSTRTVIAQAVVGNESVTDPAGFKASALPGRVVLRQGRSYRITSTERCGSGDLWYRSVDDSDTNLAAAVLQSYDTDAITLTTDCYAAGFGGTFPEDSSGKMCPLGVPTLYFGTAATRTGELGACQSLSVTLPC